MYTSAIRSQGPGKPLRERPSLCGRSTEIDVDRLNIEKSQRTRTSSMWIRRFGKQTVILERGYIVGWEGGRSSRWYSGTIANL